MACGRPAMERGVAGQAAHLSLASVTHGEMADANEAPTSISLFDQGLLQVLQASATGLEPKHAYVLALSRKADGSGPLEPLAAFTTNPAGSGDRQCDRTDPADRARRRQRATPLSGDRRRRAGSAGHASAGTGAMTAEREIIFAMALAII